MVNTLSNDWLYAVIILSASLLAIVVLHFCWRRLLTPLVGRTSNTLDDAILKPLRGLLKWGVLLTGIYYAASSLQVVQSSPVGVALLGKFLGVAWITLAIFTGIGILNAWARWYITTITERSDASRLIQRVILVRKIATVTFLALGVLYILHVVGIDISPLIAGGAVSGIIIGIALQDTLANLFAGFFMNIDRPFKLGDLIKLESGEEGFIEEIGWRHTKVRLWSNNLVIIPNSKLSQSIIINYDLPEPSISVYVWCGVAYDSDLAHVEQVVLEVAQQVQKQVQGAVADWQPIVRWREFGDFAITFFTVLRARDGRSQYLLHSEFIKALHQRFKLEGIEIPFPIRTVVFKPQREAAPEVVLPENTNQRSAS